MATLNSDYRPLVAVSLPFRGRQVYMQAVNLASPRLPQQLEDYLAPVVDLCAAAGAFEGTAYLTVDEKIVQAGNSQRRPRPHVDGCFMPAARGWGHDRWMHYCNNVGEKLGRMAVIVASSVAGCRAWRGRFDGIPASDGDLTHIASQLGDGEVLQPDFGYLLSPDCVHESMLMESDTARSFMRIALPLEYAFSGGEA